MLPHPMVLKLPARYASHIRKLEIHPGQSGYSALFIQAGHPQFVDPHFGTERPGRDFIFINGWISQSDHDGLDQSQVGATLNFHDKRTLSGIITAELRGTGDIDIIDGHSSPVPFSFEFNQLGQINVNVILRPPHDQCIIDEA